jgi:hypothetical protein
MDMVGWSPQRLVQARAFLPLRTAPPRVKKCSAALRTGGDTGAVHPTCFLHTGCFQSRSPRLTYLTFVTAGTCCGYRHVSRLPWPCTANACLLVLVRFCSAAVSDFHLAVLHRPDTGSSNFPNDSFVNTECVRSQFGGSWHSLLASNSCDDPNLQRNTWCPKCN